MHKLSHDPSLTDIHADIQLRTTHASNNFLFKTYAWMFSGLLLTAITAFIIFTSGIGTMLMSSGIALIGLFLVQVGLVIGMSSFVNRMNTYLAAFLFIFYSIVSGITITPIVMRYTFESVATTFMATSLVYGIMSIYGYFTKQDLSTFGSVALMGLVGIIIGSLVNIFLNSTIVHWILTYAGIIVFLILTAYDMQKLKNMSFVKGLTHKKENNIAIIGALSLYLDFINIFLLILRVSGGRK